MTGQRRKQAQMGEHSRMNRTEFMRQLESLLQNISATEREEALQYYNEYFNDAGPENEQNVIEALGNPVKVAENIKKDIFGNGYGENIYQKINADNRAVITYPADSGAESGAGEAGFGQENEAQAAGAVSSRKKEGMSTGMIVLIVILCILASPVILGAASAGIGVASFHRERAQRCGPLCRNDAEMAEYLRLGLCQAAAACFLL